MDMGKDIPNKAKEAQEAPQRAKETAEQTKERVSRMTEEQKSNVQGDKGENPAAKIGDKVKDTLGMGGKGS